jgi:ribosome-binding protein aMBF1 (putative translation factor)
MANAHCDREALRERFARAVTGERERRGLSQSDLAELVDVSVDHISKIEGQVYQPSFEMAAH